MNAILLMFKPCKLVIDSGTSLITGPSNDLNILYEYLSYYEDIEPLDPNAPPSQNPQGDYCTELLKLPPIVFVIDGIKYPVYADEYLISMSLDGEI